MAWFVLLLSLPHHLLHDSLLVNLLGATTDRHQTANLGLKETLWVWIP